MASDGESQLTIPCPVCQSSDRRAVWDKGAYCMSRCQGCGLFYQSPRLLEADLNARYQKGKKTKPAGSEANAAVPKEPPGKASKKPRQGDRPDSAEALANIERFKKGGELLEVGFGTGLLLVLARENGWNVQGLDVSEYIVKKAKEQYSLDVWCAKLEDSSLADDSFDVVVLRQVLEHVYDLEPFMKKVWRILKDDGLLFVEIPNIGGLDYRVKDFLASLHLRKSIWKSAYIPEHLYYFSPQTLSRLMDRHGFDVLDWETYSHFRRRGQLRYRLASLRHVLRVGNKMRFFLKKRTPS